METRPLSPFREFLPSALFMFIIGWGGLALLINLSLPTVWPRWAFFILWTLALTGTALPITWFLNLRFPGNPPAGDRGVVRQAIWVSIYGTTLAWLQLGGAGSLWVVLGLAIGLVGLEVLIRVRERSRWQPTGTDPHTSSDAKPEPEIDD